MKLKGTRKFTSVELKGQTLTRDKEPNECPICHSVIVADEIAWSLTGSTTKTDFPSLECIFKCPNQICGHLFIATYVIGNLEIYGKSGDFTKGLKLKKFKLTSTFPNCSKPSIKPSESVSISSDYVRFYDQASTAEVQNLNLLAGMGYWQSLNCLVRDALIYLFPAKKRDITNSKLDSCLSNYIKDPQINQFFIKPDIHKIITIQNDNIWTDQEVNDLKVLIRLMENWITNSMITSSLIG